MMHSHEKATNIVKRSADLSDGALCTLSQLIAIQNCFNCTVFSNPIAVFAVVHKVEQTYPIVTLFVGEMSFTSSSKPHEI